jgi:hypothetical protein
MHVGCPPVLWAIAAGNVLLVNRDRLQKCKCVLGYRETVTFDACALQEG